MSEHQSVLHSSNSPSLRELRAVIERHAGSVLRSRFGAQLGASSADVEDVTQELLADLFSTRGTLLAKWDPARGPLQAFVSMLARRRSFDLLRKRRRVVTHASQSEGCSSASPDGALESRQVLTRVHLEVQAQLSATGARMFELLYLQQQPIDEVSRETGLTPAAIYQWRCRLKKLLSTLSRACAP